MSPEFIVIDTNIFISAALSPNGTAYQAFAQAIQKFTIVQSDETYQEIADRIYRSHLRSLQLVFKIRHFSHFLDL